MRHLGAVLLLCLCVAQAAVIDFPDGTGEFRPTTCSGALWEPVKLAGKYNISIVDKCTKATHSATVTVQCPEPIPAANFSLTLEYADDQSGSSYSSYYYSYAEILLRGQVCTERDLAYQWVQTRRPSLDVDDANNDPDWLGDGDVDDEEKSSQIWQELYYPGVYQYSFIVYDGCNQYVYNTSVHYDGSRVVLLPPHSLANYETPNPRCSGDTPFVRFEKESKEVVYRVSHYGDENYGQYEWWTSTFHTEYVEVIDTLAEHMNGLPASQTFTDFDFHLTPADDRVIISYYEEHRNRKVYYIAPRNVFPPINNLPGPLNLSRFKWFEPEYSLYEYEGNNGHPWFSDQYYPQNRANATFNTPVNSNRNLEAFVYYTGNDTRVSYEATGWETMNWDLIYDSEVPICEVILEYAPRHNFWSNNLRPNEAQINFNTYDNNEWYYDNYIVRHSACVGAYNVTVVAKNGPNCTASATQLLHVSCGFAPEVRLSPQVERSVAYDYNNAYAQVTLNVLTAEPFGRSFWTTYEIIQKPQGSTIWNEASQTNTGWSFRTDYAGAYVVNVTVYNGCSATSVLEFIEVYCTSTEKPTLTVNDFSPASAGYTGVRAAQALAFTQATSVTGASNDLKATARILTGPTPFARDLVAGDISPSSTTSTSSNFYLTPRGAGTYTVQVNSTHGCGQITTVTKQFVQNCNPEPTFTVAASHTQADVVMTNANWVPAWDGWTSITLEPSTNNAYTHTYTSTPILRHTWELQSINDTAIDPATHSQYYTWVTTNSGPSNMNSITTTLRAQWYGKYVLKYWVDDGCTQRTGTHTVSVVCPASTVSLAASASNINSGDPLLLTPDFGTTSIHSRYHCYVIHTFNGKETAILMGGGTCSSGAAYSFPTYSLASGSHSFKYRVTNRCGRTTTSEAVTVTVTCPALASTVETHARETNKDALTSVTFANGRFPSIVVNASKSKSGEDNYDGVDFGVVVKVAPAGSLYATSFYHGEYDETWSDYCMSDVEDEPASVCYKDVTLYFKETYEYVRHLNTFNNWATLTPDVAGTYELEVTTSNGCNTKVQTITLTANCPAGDSKAVITNDKGVELATSASTAIPGVSFTIQSQASNILILNGTNSVVSGSSKNLFYHWYWESPARNPDSVEEYDAYNHDGLLTPYAPVLSIDPKMYPFNNRPLYLTVSDGCSRVTTAVRVNTACSGPTINLQVDKTTIFYDPVAAKKCPQCPTHVKVHAGGVCVDGRMDWMENAITNIYGGAAITANDAFMQAFPVSTGGDDDNEKLAIGLGVGLGLLFLIIVLVVLFMFYSKKKSNKAQVQPSNTEPVAATGAVEMA